MKQYFAHIRRDGSKEQLMGAHLLRVGNLMKEDAARIGLSSLAYLIGVLHDLGKCTAEFAEYLDWCHKHPEDNSRKGTVDHSSAGGQFLMQRYGRRGDSALLTVHIAALVIFSHHTGLMNYLGEDGVSDFLRRMEKIDVPEVDLSYYFTHVLSEADIDKLFEEAVCEFSALDVKIISYAAEGSEMYYFVWGMIHKLLLSMLVDADRLDSAEFELGEVRERVWDTSAIWKDFSDKLEQKLAGFTLPSELKAKEIAHLRQKISEDCLKSAEALPGIYRLCVPTGGGKTLASMRFALQHAQIYQKKRIIVVIPYTSIIDQNVKEIRDIFHMDDDILEHHSNVMTEDDGEDTERMDFRRILTERWDVPVIFTTQVQFLNTLFAGDNSSLRRLRALEDSIVIFDEIAGEIVHAAEEIGDVLCIVNLTAEARSLCEAVSERTQISERDIHVVHLSTKMCPVHRKEVLRTVREELDARRKYPEQRLICISTQLIEAGVDVSFPVVYRALAGFSSIAQAAGRCNRHGEMERGIVRLFSFTNENISRLVDIQQGKKIALDMLYHAEADTVLSPHTMELYFRKFYQGYTERDMRFPMKTTNTIFDLLSRNDAGFQRAEENGDDPNLWFSHAFHDAGYAFEVIDSHTESVLVPYAGGKSMILAFNDRYFDRKKIGEQMRTAQQYMVNLFSYELKKLSSLGALRQTESGVMALREEYYNDTFGVQMEEQSNECCMI